MINTTDSLTLHGNDVLQNAAAILQELAQKAMDAESVSGKANPELLTDRQARHRLALSIFLRIRKGRAFTYPELTTLYNLCLVPDKQLDLAQPLYTALTGEAAPHPKDVSGIRIPIRTMFVLLWTKGNVTLPHDFNISGVWAKYPELIDRSQGFIHKLAGVKTSNLHRCTRNFQYRVNWHRPEDIVFEELWEAAPVVVDKQREIKSKSKKGSKCTDFSYLTWLHLFAREHPKVVSPDQARFLEGYHAHLSATTFEISSTDNRKSYAQFVKYWGSMGNNYSKNENLQSRRARYASGIDGRKHKDKQRTEEKKARDEETKKEAQDLLPPEEYALLPGRRRPTITMTGLLATTTPKTTQTLKKIYPAGFRLASCILSTLKNS